MKTAFKNILESKLYGKNYSLNVKKQCKYVYLRNHDG